jgi:hypothetical protein
VRAATIAHFATALCNRWSHFVVPALLGIAMTIYLILFVTQPLDARRATFASIMIGK